MVSARKKKEKRKDFVKTKLKVGKDKPKSTNHTDTSFVAKSISLPNQSITSAGSAKSIEGGGSGVNGGVGLGSERLTHYLSLFKHHSPSTRREAVLYVQNHHVLPILAAESAASSSSGTGSNSSSNVGNFKSILVAATPLLTDSAPTIRAASLDLLKALPAASIAANASFIGLYIHAAMTSIDPSVRAKSTLALDVVLERAAEPLCRVAWAKLLASFITLLGWTNSSPRASNGNNSVASNSSAMVVTTSLDFGASSTKITKIHLQSLHKLLAAGLSDSSDCDDDEQVSDSKKRSGPIYATKFLVPSSSMPYLSLALFNGAQNGSNTNGGSGTGSLSNSGAAVTITEDVESRVELLRTHKHSLVNGLDQALKEGGEIGRSAKLIQALVKAQL